MEKYIVLEVFPDNHKIQRYSNDDKFECEVYISQHEYDYSVVRAKSKLIIECAEK